MPITLQVAAALLAAGSYQPPRLLSGSVETLPFGTVASGVLLLEATVDAEGRVSAVRSIRDIDPFGSVVRSSLARWRFEPAREDGRAVESQVLVAGIFRPRMLLYPAPEAPRLPPGEPPSSIPYPTAVVVPLYPPNALGDGLVQVELELADSGAVEKARVGGGSSAFDDAALEAARRWTFRAAQRDGDPVPSRAYLLFSFPAPTTLPTPRVERPPR